MVFKGITVFIFTILLLLCAFSSCTHNHYFASVPPVFARVDTNEDISYTLRPFSTLNIRVCPSKHLFATANGWVSILGSGPYALGLGQGGNSTSLGIGVHTADMVNNVQFLIEGGISNGTFRARIGNTSYISHYRYINSQYRNGAYLKAAVFLCRSDKNQLAIGGLYQQHILRYSGPQTDEIGPMFNYYDTTFVKKHFILSLNYKRNIKKYFLEFQLGFTPRYPIFGDRLSTTEYMSIQAGFGYKFGSVFKYKGRSIKF